jgi:GNAT superfamily N-acetyltransferase
MADRSIGWIRPEPIAIDHDTSLFDSGEPSLDDWLRKRAMQNMILGASRTYVVCEASSRHIAGYYALSMGQIANSETPGNLRRNMPLNIPAVVMGRLAIDRRWQGNGLGRFLLADAVDRTLEATRFVSARLLLVQAISPAAEDFYVRHGFTRLPVQTPTLALDLVKYASVRDNIGR